MGCIQSRVEPSNLENKNELKNSKSIVSQVEIIQNVSNESSRSKTYPMTISTKPMIVTSVISIQTEEPIQHPEVIVSTTLVNSTELNDYPYISINKTLNESNETMAHNNDTIRSKSIEPIETPISRINISRSIDMASDVSDIPEVSSFSSGSSELDQASSNYGPIVSSSPDFAHKIYNKDAINRFLSVRPNRPNDHRASTHNNIWSESYTSYSRRDSFVSSVSADSEGSTSDPPKGIKAVFVQTKKTNVQHKTTFSNQTYSESDESILHHTTRNNSALRDVKLIDLRSTSTVLNNPEYQSERIINETQSELNEN